MTLGIGPRDRDVHPGDQSHTSSSNWCGHCLCLWGATDAVGVLGGEDDGFHGFVVLSGTCKLQGPMRDGCCGAACLLESYLLMS